MPGNMQQVPTADPSQLAGAPQAEGMSDPSQPLDFYQPGGLNDTGLPGPNSQLPDFKAAFPGMTPPGFPPPSNDPSVPAHPLAVANTNQQLTANQQAPMGPQAAAKPADGGRGGWPLRRDTGSHSARFIAVFRSAENRNL